MIKNILHSLFILQLFATLISCKKSEYLDANPDQKLVVPETLSDFQAILDNENYMNGNSSVNGLIPEFEVAGSDDYYAISSITSLPLNYVNLYKWNDDISQFNSNAWAFNYRSIFYTNVVLDGLSKLKVQSDQQALYNNIKGSALFYRSLVFFHLAQIYAPPFDLNTANLDLGIPLKLGSDINEKVQRSTLSQTYDRIIKGLKEAIPLLPVTPLYKTRPSKPAIYLLLAKVYLAMNDYTNAFLSADSCLISNGSLLDYNTLNSTNPYPFRRFNSEVLFQTLLINNPIVLSGIARVDSLLYNSYSNDDLRKDLFFQYDPVNGGNYFRGSYDESYYLFCGLANDEAYLIRAECNARNNNTRDAMNDLNALLQKRFKTGFFVPLIAANSTEALNKILDERRKELIFRGTRWTDLRRLNKGGANITITRTLNGQTYTLAPNSLKYTYLIPTEVIGFNPNMAQNLR